MLQHVAGNIFHVLPSSIHKCVFVCCTVFPPERTVSIIATETKFAIVFFKRNSLYSAFLTPQVKPLPFVPKSDITDSAPPPVPLKRGKTIRKLSEDIVTPTKKEPPRPVARPRAGTLDRSTSEGGRRGGREGGREGRKERERKEREGEIEDGGREG